MKNPSTYWTIYKFFPSIVPSVEFDKWLEDEEPEVLDAFGKSPEPDKWFIRIYVRKIKPQLNPVGHKVPPRSYYQQPNSFIPLN